MHGLLSRLTRPHALQLTDIRVVNCLNSLASTRRAHSAAFPPRTHTCGALTADDVGSSVVLAGWLLPERWGEIHRSGWTQLKAILGRHLNPCPSSH